VTGRHELERAGDGTRQSSTFLLVVLVALRVVILVLALRDARGTVVEDSDILRFQQIAESAGRPWRDRPIEYMPGEVAAISLLAGSSPSETAQHVAIAAFVCDLGTAALLGWTFSRGAAQSYLVLGLPLLTFIYFRLDLLSVLLTAAAIACFRRRNDALAGVGLALASLVKLWPAVIVPIGIVNRRSRVTIYAVASMIVALAIWVSWGSWKAVSDVASFRGARGWDVESPIGTVVWIVSDRPPTIEQGAPRIGAIPAGVRPILLVGVALTLVIAWRRAQAWKGRPEGAPCLVAVASLLAWSPLVSLQYASWLLVPAAICWLEEEHRLPVRLTFGASLLTGVVFFAGAPSAKVVLLLRNAAVVAIVVWWFVETRSSVHENKRFARGNARLSRGHHDGI
jgi:hypothetical protein